MLDVFSRPWLLIAGPFLGPSAWLAWRSYLGHESWTEWLVLLRQGTELEGKIQKNPPQSWQRPIACCMPLNLDPNAWASNALLQWQPLLVQPWFRISEDKTDGLMDRWKCVERRHWLTQTPREKCGTNREGRWTNKQAGKPGFWSKSSHAAKRAEDAVPPQTKISLRAELSE